MLENVYEGLNARKFNGRSNQKVQKTKSIYFLILLLGGPSSPDPHQFPPDPHHFPPAPNHSSPVFGLFNFVSGRTLPTYENVYEGLNALKCI